jgi:hypothetical protein
MFVDAAVDGACGSDEAPVRYTTQQCAHKGTVYIVTGSAGKLSKADLDHKAMPCSILEVTNNKHASEHGKKTMIFMDDLEMPQVMIRIILNI